MKRRRARLRPKVRSRRRGVASSAALAVFVLAVVAGSVRLGLWSRLSLPEWPDFRLPEAASVETLSVTGAPEPLEDAIRGAVGWTPGDRWGLLRTRKVRRTLEGSFGCLRRVKAQRSWRRRTVLITVTLRRPIARILGEGSEYLGEAGRRFAAPAGVYGGVDVPELELNRLPSGKDLANVSRMLDAARRPEALPSAIARLSFEPEEGWIAVLADGTRLLWGRMRWTEEKLLRLREVLEDAAPRFGPELGLDLRYFEQGRIIVKPRVRELWRNRN